MDRNFVKYPTIPIEVKNKKISQLTEEMLATGYQGRKLGTWGDFGCFSFEEKKCMITGDGGMISSNDRGLIERLKPYRWMGIDKDTWKRAAGYTSIEVDVRHWHYEVAGLGYKYNMNDLMAAIGLAQLKKLDWMNGTYLRRLRLEEFADQAMPFLHRDLPESATRPLDKGYVRQVLALIQELHKKKGLSSVVVTHNEKVAQFCNKVYLMEGWELKLLSPQ